MASSSTISSLGVGSNLDLSSLLDGLKTSEQSRLQPLQTQDASYNSQLSAYGTLKNSLTGIQSAADALNDPKLFKSTQVNVSGDALAATSTTDAVPGRYSVNVTQLAQAQSLATAGQASQTDPIGAGGTLTLSIGDGNGKTSQSVDLDISSQNSSLQGIRDAINGADIGVNASIISDGSDTPYRLVLSSTATGTDAQISLKATDVGSASGTPLADLLDYDSNGKAGNLTQTVAAQNATLDVNGIAIESPSNTVTDAIQGVNLTLNKVSDSAQTISATRDSDAVKKAITDFVGAFNAYHKVSDTLTAYNGPGADNGVLLGDSTARTVQNSVVRALNSPVSGGAFSGLAQIGVSLQTDGTMAVDDDKLSAALTSDPTGVAKLLAGDGTDQGVAGIVSGAVSQLTDTQGAVSAATTGTQNSITKIEARMKDMQTSIDSTIERYRQQFVQLDTLMSSLNNTQSYLTTQFDQLNNSGSNKN